MLQPATTVSSMTIDATLPAMSIAWKVAPWDPGIIAYEHAEFCVSR